MHDRENGNWKIVGKNKKVRSELFKFSNLTQKFDEENQTSSTNIL